MGLDLVPLGKAKAGFEQEWELLMKPLYNGEEEPPRNYERRNEISILPYESVGAPRVGHDRKADEWMLARKPQEITQTDQEYLAGHKGYYVLELLVGNNDGIPSYSNGGLYDGVDQTCFRGAFLEHCPLLLDQSTLETAWTNCMAPQQAVTYGKKLLECSSNSPRVIVKKKRGLLGRIFGRPEVSDTSLDEQRDILHTAGRWYIFWGERGHPVSAYF